MRKFILPYSGGQLAKNLLGAIDEVMSDAGVRRRSWHLLLVASSQTHLQEKNANERAAR
jgi:hypothetical protein